MKFSGFIGQSYQLDALSVDAQRCVNLYLETIESGNGKGGQTKYLKPTPGLVKLLEIGEGPLRCVHTDPKGRTFVVSGNKIYKVSWDNGQWSSSRIRTNSTGGQDITLSTSTGPVKAASSGIDGGVTLFVDGEQIYSFWDNNTNELFNNITAYGYGTVLGATDVAFIDGYFIVNQKSTGQFFVSDLGTFQFNALSFATAEGDPDSIVGLIGNNRDLWLFNERTTEMFVNTGNVDFPFERVQGGFIEQGCVAPHSIAKSKGVLIWLGRDEFGEGVVYAASGLSPQRISTHAIEQKIASYSNIESAVAFVYQDVGHSFYVLNFDEATWVYDFSTGSWHERASTGEGELRRHRAQFHSFHQKSRTHLVGDFESNKLYSMTKKSYLDDQSVITRIRSFPYISNNRNRVFCSELELEMEVGVGESTTPNPQIVLEWSDDNARTWSNEFWAPIGRVGEFLNRVVWRRLGQFRNRVFRVKVTDPVEVVFTAAYIDVEGGEN